MKFSKIFRWGTFVLHLLWSSSFFAQSTSPKILGYSSGQSASHIGIGIGDTFNISFNGGQTAISTHINALDPGSKVMNGFKYGVVLSPNTFEKEMFVSKGYFADYVQLSWEVVRFQSQITSFKIFRRELGSGQAFVQVSNVSGSTTSWKDEFSEANVLYEYKLKAEGIFPIETLFLNTLTGVGFRLPSGKVSGRVTYKGGGAVQGVTLIPETEDNFAGSSLFLDGTSSYFAVSPKANDTKFSFANNFTFQAWVKPTSTGVSTLFQKGSQYKITHQNGQINFNANGTNLTLNFTQKVDTFFNVTVQRTTDSLKIYVLYDNEKYYKTSVAFAGTTPTNSNEILIGKNISNSEYFSGNIDEVRIWSRALPLSEILRESFRLIAGTEDGLSAYYRMNEGVGSNFYDLSRKGFTFNENHGFMSSTVSWSSVVPLRAQLSVKGYTDFNGNYLITGIPYTSDGSTYRIVPAFGVHSFDPTERLLFIGPGSNIYSDVNFEDIASFIVTGKVFYKNTSFPVEGVNIKIDGLLAINSDGQPISTNSIGEFTIDVPIGKHQLQMAKNGHVFRGGGFFPDSNNTYDFQQNYTIQRDFIDTTLIKVIGKVVGGPVEESKTNGLGRTINNIGHSKFVMTTQKGYLLSRSSSDSSGVWDNGFTHHLTGYKKYGETNFKFPISNPAQVEIKPDEETGEYFAYLLPEKYVVNSVVAGNPDATSPNYIFDNSYHTVVDLSNYFQFKTSRDSVVDITDFTINQQTGDTTFGYLFDSVQYNVEKNFILRVNPSVALTSITPGVERFWEDKVSTKDGEELTIVSSDNYGDWLTEVPVFLQRKPYKVKVNVFEAYQNVEEGNKVDKVPVIDGVVRIQNELAIDTKVNSYKLNEFGYYIYEFEGGLPRTTTGGIGDFQKSMTVKVFTGKGGSIATDWPAPGQIFKGYVFGGMPTGNNFVTAGPNVVNMILRDPHGSGSYAFYETGTSTTKETSLDVSSGESTSLDITASFGTDVVTFAGIGAGVIIKTENDLDFGIGLSSERTYTSNNTFSTTTTNTSKWSTSSNPLFVGAAGDVFIGNSSNIVYGKNVFVELLPDSKCDVNSKCDSALTISGKKYNIGLSNGIRISPKFGTGFQYTQNHIQNYLIPQLKFLRDAFYLKKRNIIVGGGKTEYECVICSGAQYGSNNDKATMSRRVDNSGIDGSSYKINYPVGFDFNTQYVDSLAWYNEQIKGWENLLERNEREKTESVLKQNYSYDAGTVFESTTTVEDTKTSSETFSFNIDRSISEHMGLDALGLGWSIDLNITSSKGKTKSTSTGETKSTTFGFVLNDGDLGDFYSMDVKDPRNGTGPVFAVKGGQSMCPYVGSEVSKYHNPGTILSEATAKREVPKLSISPAIVSNVPQGKSANFGLFMSNATEVEVGDDAWYRLAIDESTIVGGKITIDGSEVREGRSFFIPGGTTLTKTLNISQAIPDSFKFENIRVVLHSLCQYDPSDDFEDISDTAEISAYFQPACTPITISNPSDLWLINTSGILYSGTEVASIPMTVGLRNYDLNHSTFEKIAVQYKSSSSSQWISDMIYYMNQSDFNAASEPRELIDGKAQIDYTLEMKSLRDRNYDVRLQTFCADGTRNESEIVRGIKDVKRPKLFGSPQPGDGILSPGDDISVTFDEDILQGLLTSANFSVRGVLNGADIAHNSVLYFDGIDDYASAVEGVKLTDKSFTIEFWTKRLRDGAKEVIYSQGEVEYGFTNTDNFYAKFGSQILTTSVSFPAIDVWQHYAIVYNYTTKKVSIYKDDDIVLDELDVPTKFLNSGRMNIGSSSTNSNFYKGYIHDFRVWETARGYGSVVSNMNVTQTGDKIGLSGFWPMDEADGKIAKDLSRNHHAVLKGATWAVFPVGYASNFLGSDYMTIPAGQLVVTEDMDMTLEFWIKAPSQTNKVIFSNGKGDGTDSSPATKNIWVIGSDADGKLYAKNNGVSLTVNKNVFDNNWHHVALVLKRIGNTALYIDGNQEVFNQSTNFGGLSGAQFTLGARQFRTGGSYIYDQNFTGKIDELRIWKLARTKTLIELDKNSKLKGSEIGLMAYYPFDVYDIDLILQSTFINQAEEAKDTLKVFGATASQADVPNIKDARPVQNVGYDWVVNGDKIIINLTEDAEAIEKTVLEFTVLDIQDLNENRLASPITWTAYIRKNTVLWNESVLNFEKNISQTVSFNVEIINRGGTEQNYQISNLPSWLLVDVPSGTLAPDSKRTLNFEINDAVNIGSYEQSIFLGSDFGFLEKLEINLKVKGEEPNWVVDPSRYDNNMSVVGILRLNGIISTNPDDKIAAFVNEEIRGVANLQYIASYDQYEFFLDIYSNEADGEQVEFKVWNASLGKIQVNVTPQLIFEKNSILGTPSNPTVFSADNNISIEYPLKKGWNWISFNLDAASFTNSNLLFSTLDPKEGDIIKTQGKFDQYNPTFGWLGEITRQGGFELPYSYKINVSKPDTFLVVGSEIETQSVVVPITTGWNWIGYPSQMQMGLNDALANVDFQNGDFIKGQNGFAIYDQFLGWIGSLKTLQPTKGYMLKSSDNYTLTYPNPDLLARARFTSTGGNDLPLCALSPEAYSKDMAFVARLNLCNTIISSASDYLMVKVNGECRGVIEPSYIQSMDKYVFFLTAYSNTSEEELSFSYYNSLRDSVFSISEKQAFISDAIMGSLEQPFQLTVIDNSICKVNAIQGAISDLFHIYPNPFDNKLMIELKDNSKPVSKIYISDMIGREIANFDLEQTIQWEAKTPDGQELPIGVYMINVETPTQIYQMKIVKN